MAIEFVVGTPVGRTATAQTDAQMHADILSWSRSQGLSAGVALKGATYDDQYQVGRHLEFRLRHTLQHILASSDDPGAVERLAVVETCLELCAMLQTKHQATLEVLSVVSSNLPNDLPDANVTLLLQGEKTTIQEALSRMQRDFEADKAAVAKMQRFARDGQALSAEDRDKLMHELFP